MKQVEKLKDELEAQYSIPINEFLDLYESNMKLKDMLVHFETSTWKLKTVAAALNLRMARKYRVGDLAMLTLRASDSADKDLMIKLEEQNETLEQLSVDYVNQSAELIRSRSRTNLLRRGLREAARAEGVYEYIDKIVSDVTPMKAPKKLTVNNKKADGRIQFITLSDLHCEEIVIPENVPSGGYSWDIMVGRLKSIFKKAIKTKGDVNDLHIYILGDIINGFIHGSDVNASKHPIVALTELSGVLSSLIASIIPHYSSVEIFTVTGNHDRLTEAPAVLHKSYDFSYLFYKLMEAHLINYPATFNISENGLLVTTVGNKNNVFVGLGHGDQIAGGRGQAGDLKALEFFKSTFGVDITHMVQGHFHVPSITSLASRGYCITNGSLIGPGSYSHIKGLIPTPWSQYIGIWGETGNLELIQPISK